MTDSRRSARGAGLALVLALFAGDQPTSADTSALDIRATVASAASPTALTISVHRWSTDAERAPFVAALAAPAPAPPAPAAADAGAGRGGRGGGRGGRGGGRGAAPVQSPMARLTAAVKAAPTLGFVWGDGVTGYSIKYAWRSMSGDRIVLVTDRRLGAHAPDWAPASAAAADAEFTLIEMRVDAKGAGEGKTSLTTPVVIDATAQTLALDGYQSAPALLKVSR